MEKIIYDEIITAGHFRLLARKDVQTARAFVCLSENRFGACSGHVNPAQVWKAEAMRE
jgi:hypothetical protein